MPSPSIPRSKSDPRISATHHSPSHSDVLSHRSSWSEYSPRTWTKKVGALVARKTSSLSSSSKKSILTEESLKEFNRLNEILEQKKYLNYSPYYRGLTDSSLAINPPRRPSLPSPHVESHAGAGAGGSLLSLNSKTGIIHKVQEWGTSFFISKDKDEKISESSSSKSRSSLNSLAPTPSLSLSSSSSSSRSKATAATIEREKATKMAKELGHDQMKEFSSSTNTSGVTATAILNRRKPLRERVFESPSTQPTQPHPGTKMTESQRPRSTPIQTSEQAKPPRLPKPVVQTSTRTQRVQTMPPLQPPIMQHQTAPTEMEGKEQETNKPDNDRKYMWADNYRPFALKDFLCNRSKALELLATVKSENSRHVIFEGHPGVGKRTMIWALLREAFGEDKVQATEENKKFILKGEAIGSINVKIKQSTKHVEINLSDLTGYEKHVIMELIKESRSDKSTNQVSHNNLGNCRAIILYEADRLPNEALLYIKWALERYKGCNKLFFCCSDASKIQPLTSLCTLVQLLPPSIEEITQVLEFIAEKEGIKLPQKLAVKIAKSSKNNLRQAIRSFEATWQFNSVLKEDQEIMTGWEDDIANIARNIIEEQSPKQLYNIRGKLQNLIEHNVSAVFIFETLVKELKKNLDEKLQKHLDNLYEKYNVQTQKNDCEKHYAPSPNRQEEMGKRLNDPVRKIVQQFMRIEEFIAKFMSWYKGLVVKNKEIQTHAL